MLVIGGRVHAIGDVNDLRRAFPAADIVDFGDAVLTPGLTDAHIHITEWALARRHVHLDAAENISDCVAIVGRAPKTTGWLQGRGWNPHRSRRLGRAWN